VVCKEVWRVSCVVPINAMGTPFVGVELPTKDVTKNVRSNCQ
jgi:hypothetical protein